MNRPIFFPASTPWPLEHEQLLALIHKHCPSFHLKLFAEDVFGFEFVHRGEHFTSSVKDPNWATSNTPYNMLLLGMRTVEVVLDIDFAKELAKVFVL